LGRLAQLAQLGQLVWLVASRWLSLAMAATLKVYHPETLDLLILQPTPFCNLDCRYCYLPDRSNTKRMSMETLRQTLHRVVEGAGIGESLSIVWHAGEPLVVPREWYADAFAAAHSILPPTTRCQHHFQTNGVLVDDNWCAFIREHGVRVGVSVDGPERLHDLSRHTRRGGGTHRQVMAGVSRLQSAGITPHAICVLTRPHLDHPDEVFDFFVENAFREIGFNIEEVDGVNHTSSLEARDTREVFARFFSRIVARYREDPGRLAIREIDRVLAQLMESKPDDPSGNAQTRPFAIVSVGWDGSIGTFSPELLATADPRLGFFAFGNVATHALADIASDFRFQSIAGEIARGVRRCRRTCPYFVFCRGGAPSNKLGETSRLDTTATTFCTLTQMIVIETVLDALERDLDAS
jgi:uncharacterized protein